MSLHSPYKEKFTSIIGTDFNIEIEYYIFLIDLYYIYTPFWRFCGADAMFVLVQLELLRVPALEVAQLAAVLDDVCVLETAALLRSTSNRKAATTFV